MAAEVGAGCRLAVAADVVVFCVDSAVVDKEGAVSVVEGAVVAEVGTADGWEVVVAANVAVVGVDAIVGAVAVDISVLVVADAFVVENPLQPSGMS